MFVFERGPQAFFQILNHALPFYLGKTYNTAYHSAQHLNGMQLLVLKP